MDLESVAGGSVALGVSKGSSDVSMSGDSDWVVVVDGEVKVMAPREPTSMRTWERREYGMGSGSSLNRPIFGFVGDR